MIITIECRINVDGTWWDITTEHLLGEYMKTGEKVEHTKKIVKGLASAGLISRVAIKDHPTAQTEKGPAELRGEADASAGQIEIPPPICEVHRGPMKVSKVQKKAGHTEFYCSLKDGNGKYCKNRATVLDVTGIPKFWSVQ